MNEEIIITTDETINTTDEITNTVNEITNTTGETNNTTEEIVFVPNQDFIDYGNCLIASLGLLLGLLIAFCFGLGFNSTEK